MKHTIGALCFVLALPATSLTGFSQNPSRIINTRTTAEGVRFQQLDYVQARYERGLTIWYEGLLDREPFTVTYEVKPRQKSVVVSIFGLKSAGNKPGIRYVVSETAQGLLDFEVRLGELVMGMAKNRPAGEVAALKVKPELYESPYFEILAYLPHELEGFAPQDLFADQADAEPEMTSSALKVGNFLNKLFGGIKIGGGAPKRLP